MISEVAGATLPGLLLGLLVGAMAQFTTFCSVGAVADVILARDWRRARSWIMAAAVALAGTQAAMWTGLAPRTGHAYEQPWIFPSLSIAGGLTFGYGMAIAGGCLQRALVRVGAGSLKSLVTIVVMAGVGVGTAMILPAGILKATAWPASIPSSLYGVTAAAFHLNYFNTQVVFTIAIAVGLIAFCVKDSWFLKSPGHLWGGILIGAAVAMAWVEQPHLTQQTPRAMNPFADLMYGMWAVSPSFTSSPSIDAAIPRAGYFIAFTCILLGIVAGSFLVALIRRDLMVDRFVDRWDAARHVAGGALMGIGGTLMLGCSFGQGLSGFATLSITSMIAVAGMIAGCIWGIRALEAGSAWRGLRLCFGRKAS